MLSSMILYGKHSLSSDVSGFIQNGSGIIFWQQFGSVAEVDTDNAMSIEWHCLSRNTFFDEKLLCSVSAGKDEAKMLREWWLAKAGIL